VQWGEVGGKPATFPPDLPAITPASIGAVSGEIAFFEDFENASRYPNGTLLVTGETMPIFGNPIRVSYGTSGAGTNAIVTGGGYGDKTSRTWYVGSNVDVVNDRFSFGVEVSCLPTDSPASLNGWALNMSFHGAEILSAEVPMTIYPSGIMHINMLPYGLTAVGYYTQAFGAVGATNVCATADAHCMETGDKLYLSGTQLPSGTSVGTYYGIKVSATEFKVASSYANAIAGTALDIGTVAYGLDCLLQIDDITCLNRELAGGALPFHPTITYAGEAPGFRTVILFEMEGEYLTITRSGFGSVVFRIPSLARKIGNQAHFWAESRGDRGGDANMFCKLHKIWANAPVLDLALCNKESDRFKINAHASNHAGMGAGLPGYMKLTNASGSIGSFGNAPGDARFQAGYRTTKTMDDRTVAIGGHTFIEGGYLSNVGGLFTNGHQLYGRASAALDTNILAELKSATTGSEVTLKDFRRCNTLEPGDRQITEILGRLVAGTKTIRLSILGIQELFTSGAITHTGVFKIRVTRKCLTGAQDTTYIEFYANNTLVSMSRAQFANATAWDYRVHVTQDTANIVILEDIRTEVEKVKY
jgi:hypothetical protein